MELENSRMYLFVQKSHYSKSADQGKCVLNKKRAAKKQLWIDLEYIHLERALIKKTASVLGISTKPAD